MTVWTSSCDVCHLIISLWLLSTFFLTLCLIFWWFEQISRNSLYLEDFCYRNTLPVYAHLLRVFFVACWHLFWIMSVFSTRSCFLGFLHYFHFWFILRFNFLYRLKLKLRMSALTGAILFTRLRGSSFYFIYVRIALIIVGLSC